MTVDLYGTVACGTNPGTPCDARGDYELAPDGSYAHGKLLNTYVSETWERPTSGASGNDCLARNVDGSPLVYPADQQVLPVGPDKGCLEGPLMGVQFGTYATDQGTPDANFGAAVDGNYGFGDGCFDGTLVATDPSAPLCAVSGGSITGVLRTSGTLASVLRTERHTRPGAPHERYARPGAPHERHRGGRHLDRPDRLDRVLRRERRGRGRHREATRPTARRASSPRCPPRRSPSRPPSPAARPTPSRPATPTRSSRPSPRPS